MFGYVMISAFVVAALYHFMNRFSSSTDGINDE
jgi:hypothetical protein